MQASGFGTGMEMDFGFEVAADGFGVARLFEGDQNGGANLSEVSPPFGGFFADAGG